jgi:hypothetical protein
VRAYDGGEGLADEGIMGASRGVGRVRGGELEPVGGGNISAMAEEEELTLGRRVNPLGVVQTLKAGEVSMLFRDHGTELVGDPLLIAAREGAHYLKAVGGSVGRARDRGGEEGEVASVRVDGQFIKVGSQVAVGRGHGAKGAEAAPGTSRVRMPGVDVAGRE